QPHSRSAAFYMNHGWESFVEKFPQVVDTSDSGIAPRELMLGIATGSGSKAFPWKSVISAGLIQDRVGNDDVLIVVGPDGISARAFRTPGNTTFFRSGPANSEMLADTETSSLWNFGGNAVRGPLAGQHLQPIYAV